MRMRTNGKKQTLEVWLSAAMPPDSRRKFMRARIASVRMNRRPLAARIRDHLPTICCSPLWEHVLQ